ncbi:hypothetical protein [Parerythrobacter aestuarii]|uniref:hypothetical protein n=1 Tax=Parerythrobacter aestuarii TaxID=3020909 RepID=UPI0024DEE350|nr:hypothetical protein [Parerythrobacter aestuarii]
MPNRTDKTLFMLGLFSYLCGQVWIVSTGSMTKEQSVIDWIHWLMFIGAALMIPFAARLPRAGLSMVAGPLQVIGCILIIGMCMIDFVLWSFPDPDLRKQVVGGLINTPAVWQPFIAFAGPVFTVAFGLVGLTFWRVSKIGTALAVLGAIVVGAWGIGSNPYGYTIALAGFAVCFWTERKAESSPE